jgi:hypothetical protein
VANSPPLLAASGYGRRRARLHRTYIHAVDFISPGGACCGKNVYILKIFNFTATTVDSRQPMQEKGSVVVKGGDVRGAGVPLLGLVHMPIPSLEAAISPSRVASGGGSVVMGPAPRR